ASIFLSRCVARREVYLFEEVELQKSLDLLEQIHFATSYVFKYSPHPNTPAVRLDDSIPETEKDRRCTLLVRAQEKISLANNKAAIGQMLEVLVEKVSKKNETKLSNHSRDNRIYMFTNSPLLEKQLVSVRIQNATTHTLYCKLISGRSLPIAP